MESLTFPLFLTALTGAHLVILVNFWKTARSIHAKLTTHVQMPTCIERNTMTYVRSYGCTGLYKMIVGVLTTCHIESTWDRSICIFLFNRTTLQVFVVLPGVVTVWVLTQRVDGVVTHSTKFVFLYSCNNNMALKMTRMPAETCWWEFHK